MTLKALIRSASLTLASLAGCGGGDSSSTDAASVDGTRFDARAWDAVPADAALPDAGPTAIERGARLADLGDCARCHSPARHLEADGVPFCGNDLHLDLQTADPLLGQLPAPNLTNHSTGLADFTDELIERAVRQGIGGDGRQLHWSMSYWKFALFTDDEMADLIAFLRSLPPCDNPVSALRQAPGFVIPSLTPMTWDDVPESTLAPADPGYAAAQRGRRGAAFGPCISCHSGPENTATATGITTPFTGGYGVLFTGGRSFGTGPVYVSRNLTPDATGLLGWAASQVRGTLGLGLDIDGQYVCAPMTAHVGANADQSPEDALDLGVYFTTMPPVVNDTGTNPTCTTPPAELVIGPGGTRGTTPAVPVAFGSVTVGLSSGPITFRVTNASAIETSGVLGAAIATGDFAVVTDGCVGLALPPTGKVGGSMAALPGCTITARFTPTADGAATGSLAITGTPGGTTTAALAGLGVDP